MLWAYLKAAIGVALILCTWVAVERAWRRMFGDGRDAAAISGCRGCLVCTRRCEPEGHEHGDHQSDHHEHPQTNS
ncbi:hypothetical protein [Haliangium sp.]|uniref:hypothetical protein n=1 Tax=Haliangium sp. TaxID=2663208 RepID=UPI003D0D9391